MTGSGSGSRGGSGTLLMRRAGGGMNPFGHDYLIGCWMFPSVRTSVFCVARWSRCRRMLWNADAMTVTFVGRDLGPLFDFGRGRSVLMNLTRRSRACLAFLSCPSPMQCSGGVHSCASRKHRIFVGLSCPYPRHRGVGRPWLALPLRQKSSCCTRRRRP